MPAEKPKNSSPKDASAKSGSEAKSTPACPICGQPRELAYRPFCSKRCADIDLNRWLTGQYAIPVEEEEPDDMENLMPGTTPGRDSSGQLN